MASESRKVIELVYARARSGGFPYTFVHESGGESWGAVRFETALELLC